MRRRGEAGFTLVEMLVSLGILSLLAVMLLQGLRTTGYFAARAAAQSAGNDQLAAAQRLLRGRLERVHAVTRSTSARALVDAQGNENSFTFYGPPLARSEPDAPWRYRIVTTASGDLVLYWANGLDDRYDYEAEQTMGWQPIILLENVGRLSINYYGADPRGRGRRWQTLWRDRPQPPDLIRVRLSFRPGDPRRWPDLIVRPRATVNTACRIDKLTGRCEGDA